MFGLFKGKKAAIEQMAANIATLLNNYLWSFREKFSAELANDKFILGYISGVAQAGLYVLGFKKARDKAQVLHGVFEFLFPGNSELIVPRLKQWAVTENDKEFLAAVTIGIRDSSIFYKAMRSGKETAVEEAIGALKSLKDHLDKNYA